MFRGDRLTKWRKIRKLTQEELALKIKMTKSAISNYENGHSSPSDETLVALADCLDVDTDYLLGRRDTPKFETNISFFGGPDNYTSDEIDEMEAALLRYREMKKRAAEQVDKQNN